MRRALAWVLVGAGTALVAFPALTYGTGALRQSRLAAEVRTLLGPEAPASVAPPRTSARVAAVRPAEGQPLGTVEIPSIGVSAAFLEGVTDDVLLAGPGHLPGTALPGTGDVSVLAAHRDMHFKDLHQVATGDTVRLRLPGETILYRVTGRRIVQPDDTSVTALRGRPMLRLVTCWPPNFVGPAPERLVVSAELLRAPRPIRPANGGRIAATTTVRPAAAEPVPLGSLAPLGTVGAVVAGLSAFGAARGRRRAGWFLPWFGGLGLASLTLLMAWAGPALARSTHLELSAHREVIPARAPRFEAPMAAGGGLYRLGRVTLAWDAMEGFLRAQRILGMEIEVTDSHRTRAMQAAAHSAKPGLAAPPGHSMHELGLAIDVHTGFLAAHPEVRDALYAAGWRQFDPHREPWHFSWRRAG